MNQSRLVLDEAKHAYSLDGRYLPGVSGILKSAGLVDLSGIPEEVLNAARDFGTAVHMACELYDRGILAIQSISDPIIPYLSAWMGFVCDNGVEIKEIEKGVYSEKYWYAGKLDRIAVINDKLTLIDIKSSASIYPSMRIQLAAYQLAWEEQTKEKIKKRIIVQLQKSGKYKIEDCNEPSDKDVFLCALQIAKWKKKNNKGEIK